MVVRRFALWVLSWILKIFPTQMLSMQRDSDTQWQRDLLLRERKDDHIQVSLWQIFPKQVVNLGPRALLWGLYL